MPDLQCKIINCIQKSQLCADAASKENKSSSIEGTWSPPIDATSLCALLSSFSSRLSSTTRTSSTSSVITKLTFWPRFLQPRSLMIEEYMKWERRWCLPTLNPIKTRTKKYARTAAWDSSVFLKQDIFRAMVSLRWFDSIRFFDFMRPTLSTHIDPYIITISTPKNEISISRSTPPKGWSFLWTCTCTCWKYR